MESERLPKEVIQGAFDLLASLVKNNIKAFQLLNDMLLTEESVSDQGGVKQHSRIPHILYSPLKTSRYG